MGAWTETLQTAGDALEDAVAGMVRSAAAHLLAHSRAPTRAAAHLAGRGPAHSGQRLAGQALAGVGGTAAGEVCCCASGSARMGQQVRRSGSNHAGDSILQRVSCRLQRLGPRSHAVEYSADGRRSCEI